MAIQLFPSKYIPGVDPPLKRSLNFSVLDACLWAFMFGVGESFIVPFALHFNASAFLISIMTSGVHIVMFFGCLLSILLLRFSTHRKKTTVITNILQGVTYVFLFWTAFATSNPIFILIFYVLGIFISTLAMSSWFTWMNDLVPERIRGIYWGGRNKYSTIVQVVATVAAGFIMSYYKGRKEDIIGFGIIFMLAALFRILSGFAIMGQHHPEMKTLKVEEHFSLFTFIGTLWKTNLGKFVIFSILFTFSTNIMPTLISVHLLKSLHVSLWQFAIINAVFSISFAIFMPYWGRMADKYGNKRVFVFTTSIIPIVALAWAGFRDFHTFLIIQVISGFVWSGSMISGQNFIIDNSNPRTLALNHPYYQSLNSLAAFGGALTGGFLSLLVMKIPSHVVGVVPLTELRLELIFILSALLRMIVILFLIRGIKEVKEKPSSTEPEVHVFIFQPALELANSFFPVAFISKHTKRGFQELTNILGRLRRKP